MASKDEIQKKYNELMGMSIGALDVDYTEYKEQNFSEQKKKNVRIPARIRLENKINSKLKTRELPDVL